MPSTSLRGSYKLGNDTIDQKVTKKSAGAYALGHVEKRKKDKKEVDVFVVEYVGRSDDDVNDRLKKWVGKGYTHFKFEYYGSSQAAFDKECKLYHDWKKQLDNKQHPDRPDGSNWQCPKCDAFKDTK